MIVIRHGETGWNLAGRMQGHVDSPLTALVLHQARAAGRRLRETHLDAVVSSRARSSASGSWASSRA
jgi:probable phosphoglycerate mutase